MGCALIFGEDYTAAHSAASAFELLVHEVTVEYGSARLVTGADPPAELQDPAATKHTKYPPPGYFASQAR